MSVVNKDISSQVKRLGQYMTPPDIADWCLEKTRFPYKRIIEPSCGEGVFLDRIKARAPKANLTGVELDSNLACKYDGPEEIICLNFYDYRVRFKSNVHFLGNPPYRSPAYSLQTHNKYIRSIRKKHNILNIREEAALFIVHALELIRSSNVKGRIDYILPKAIFHNNSVAYTAFKEFLKREFQLVAVWDLEDEFPGVWRDLVYVTLETLDKPSSGKPHLLLNGKKKKVDDFYQFDQQDWIPFQDIFRKTHLGSVPCESIFLSGKDEPKKHLRDRLVRLFTSEVTEDNIIDLLSYKGEPHLLSLKRRNPNKIKVVADYARAVPEIEGFDIALFEDLKNYKPIRHRDEDRWYFRHDFLKRGPFVYQTNPNPCPSFYFPGNPSSTSADYFGFCDYDINRNSGPGANRTVPIEGVEENLQEDFKVYWDNLGLPYEAIFDYMIHISKSDWYRKMKQNHQRFYFSIPRDFDTSFRV